MEVQVKPVCILSFWEDEVSEGDIVLSGPLTSVIIDLINLCHSPGFERVRGGLHWEGYANTWWVVHLPLEGFTNPLDRLLA